MVVVFSAIVPPKDSVVFTGDMAVVALDGAIAKVPSIDDDDVTFTSIDDDVTCISVVLVLFMPP